MNAIAPITTADLLALLLTTERTVKAEPAAAQPRAPAETFTDLLYAQIAAQTGTMPRVSRPRPQAQKPKQPDKDLSDRQRRDQRRPDQQRTPHGFA